MFHFDNEEITSDILEDIRGIKPQIFESKEKLSKSLKEMMDVNDE